MFRTEGVEDHYGQRLTLRVLRQVPHVTIGGSILVYTDYLTITRVSRSQLQYTRGIEIPYP